MVTANDDWWGAAVGPEAAWWDSFADLCANPEQPAPWLNARWVKHLAHPVVAGGRVSSSRPRSDGGALRCVVHCWRRVQSLFVRP